MAYCLSPQTRRVGREFFSVRCGKCEHCLERQMKCWTAKLALEWSTSLYCSFVTLTFAEEHLPDQADYTIFQDFLRRLRRSVPEPIRYFCTLEQGSLRGRPHFHVLFFQREWKPDKLTIWKAWQQGFCDIRHVTSLGLLYYAAKYTQKEGHTIGYSKRPPLGAFAIRALAQSADRWSDALPEYLNISGRKFPLSDSLRRMYAHALEELQGDATSVRSENPRSKGVSAIPHQDLKGGSPTGEAGATS